MIPVQRLAGRWPMIVGGRLLGARAKIGSWLRLDGAAEGIGQDSGPSGRHLTVHDGVSPVEGSGRFGGGVRTDGLRGHLDRWDDTFNLSGAFAMLLHVQIERMDTQWPAMQVVNFGKWGFDFWPYKIEIRGGRLAYIHGGGASARGVLLGDRPGKYMVLIWRDGGASNSRLVVDVNGDQVFDGPAGFPVTPGPPGSVFRIGTAYFNPNAEPFPGIYRELRLWNFAKDLTTLRLLALSGPAGIANRPLGDEFAAYLFER